jgi:hypothetical protein
VHIGQVRVHHAPSAQAVQRLEYTVPSTFKNYMYVAWWPLGRPVEGWPACVCVCVCVCVCDLAWVGGVECVCTAYVHVCE